MKTCDCDVESESVEVWSLASSAFSAVANLVQDVVLRIRVSADRETWRMFAYFMVCNKQYLRLGFVLL